MRSQFPGYYAPTVEELQEHWSSALFVLDANVLLNFYRYSDRTVAELKAALDDLAPRLWLPHQAALEFHDNRLGVIASEASAFAKVREEIEKLVTKLESTTRHPTLSDETQGNLREAVSQAMAELTGLESRLRDYASNDPILAHITTLFDARVGGPYPDEERDRLIAEFRRRVQRGIPPGFRDLEKDAEHRRAGDFILWRQILDEARRRETPVIFVTDDRKDDWWRRVSGKTLGPRPELVSEMLRDAGQRFHMYSMDGFVRTYRSQSSEEDISQSTMDEVRSVSRATSSPGSSVIIGALGGGMISALMVDRAAPKTPVLRDYELAVLLATLDAASPGRGASVYFIQRSLEGAGYTNAALLMGVRGLVSKGFLLETVEEDRGEEYDALRLTDRALDWLDEHQDQVPLRREAPPEQDDDLPF